MRRNGAALLCSVAIASCGAFGSKDDGANACPGVTCDDAGPSCRAYAFDTDCGDLRIEGDLPRVVAECSGGKLHLAAKDTLDATATLDETTPQLPYSIRIAVRVQLTQCDTGEILTVRIGDGIAAQVKCAIPPSGTPRLELCDGSSTCALETVAFADERLLVLDFQKDAVSMTVGCERIAQLAPVALPTAEPLHVVLGKIDAKPLDFTADDFVVAFH